MSHDQRPGKVRVIDHNASAALPEVMLPPVKIDAERQIPTKGIPLLFVGMFLLACGVGGALVEFGVVR